MKKKERKGKGKKETCSENRLYELLFEATFVVSVVRLDLGRCPDPYLGEGLRARTTRVRF